MKKWVVAPQADGDWDAIWQYWYENAGAEAVKKLEAEFVEAFNLLAERPLIGHVRADVKRPVRFWNVRDYLVIYWPGTDPLEILRLAHGAQDIPRVVRDIP